MNETEYLAKSDWGRVKGYRLFLNSKLKSSLFEEVGNCEQCKDTDTQNSKMKTALQNKESRING